MQAAILAEFGRSDVSESKLDDLHGIVAVLRVYQKHLRSTGLVEISWSHHSLPQHLQLATCYVTELLRMDLRGKHSLHDSISMFTLANKPTQGMDSGTQSNKFKRNKPSTVKKNEDGEVVGKRHEQGQEKSMESMINTAMFCKGHSGKGGLKPSGVPTSLRGTKGTKLRYQELGKSESVLHFYLSTLSLIKIEWTKGLLKIQQVKNTTNLPTTFPRVSRRFNLSGAGLVARDKSALLDNGKTLQITQKKFVLVILMLCC